MRIFHWRLVGVCLLLVRPGWGLELTLASPSEFSAAQYTQETCILIVSERDSLAPGSQRYLELDDSFRRHCQLPVELPRKQGLPSASVQPSHLSSIPPKYPPVPPGSGIQALGTNDT